MMPDKNELRPDEVIAIELGRIANALEKLVAVAIPRAIMMSAADREIASDRFLDTVNTNSRCKSVLRREKICDPHEITRERLRNVRNCGKVTTAELIELRDRLLAEHPETPPCP